MPDSKPAHFGPYKLMKTVGQGQFGKVKMALDSRSEKQVAIKLMKKERISSAAKRAFVMREISVMQALDHPYIVKLIEVVESDAYIGIVMELAAGGEMHHYIMAHGGKLEESEARHFFAQLVVGLSYIHSAGIIHRDLKLENLLLSADNNILISDFGFAAKSSEHLTSGCGSFGYIAPEVFVGQEYNGFEADIWSCGVINYGMLCGYLPFDDDPANPDSENLSQLYKYMNSHDITYPDFLSPLARDITSRMLVLAPNMRATMAEVIEHEWLIPEAAIFQKELARKLKQPSPKIERPDPIYTKKLSAAVRRTSASTSHDDELSSVDMIRTSSSPGKLHSPWFRNKRTFSDPPVFIPAHLASDDEQFAFDVSDAGEDSDNGRHSATYARSTHSAGKRAPWFSTSKRLGSDPPVYVPSQLSGEDDQFVFDVSDLAGPPSGSYAASYAHSFSNSERTHRTLPREKKLEIHSGPVDKKAITTRDPHDLLMDLEIKFEHDFGWQVLSNGDTTGKYRLKVLKPRGVTIGGKNESAAKQGETEEYAFDASTTSFKDSAEDLPQMNRIANSLPVSWVSKIKRFIHLHGPNASKGFNGNDDPLAHSAKGLSRMQQEMTFTVEIRQIKNQSAYVVEFRRLQGDVYGFKRLYAEVIELLPLKAVEE